MRIARALALGGVASRRKCEAHITAGEVTVNGEVVRDLGRQVEPGKDRVLFRGKPLSLQPEQVYFILHKPAGYTTTASDPHAEKTVYDLLPSELKGDSPLQGQSPIRVFPVGRLDQNSTGLLLFTNDGELANRLTHPRYEVGKRYWVVLDRMLDGETRAQLMKGIPLEEGIAKVEEIRPGPGHQVELLLKEGKKREIRRMFSMLGYTVKALCRVSLGPLKLGNLPPGKGRALTPAEITALRRAASLPV